VRRYQLSISRRKFLKLSVVGSASAILALPAEPAVGFLFPASDRPVPPEASTLYPTGIRFLADGIGLGRTLPEGFHRLIDQTIPGAIKMSKAGANAIVLMSPSVSFYKGAAFNQRISAGMTRATGLPCITARTALVEGLNTVRAGWPGARTIRRTRSGNRSRHKRRTLQLHERRRRKRLLHIGDMALCRVGLWPAPGFTK
jgi:hypothetical protein